MNTELISSMFKGLFGTSITPTSSQCVPITAADGTPAGISSMANLASVLGVPKYEAMVNNSDCNDIGKFGIYVGSNANTIANRPDPGSFLILHIPQQGDSSEVFLQIATCYEGKYFIRMKWGGVNISAWKEL